MFNITPTRPNYDAPKAAAKCSARDLLEASTKLRAAGRINDANIAHDMAQKLARFGSFVSEKQEAFALALIQRAKTCRASDPVIVVPVQKVPSLFAVMQKHTAFYLGDVTLSRRNQDSLVWIKHAKADKVIGKIEGGVVTLFSGRINVAGVDAGEIVALLDDLEANPLAAAVKFGKLSGRCCSCGRDLTDPDSIEAGIGPVCVLKFNV